MSSTLRTAIAALALAFSAFVMTLSSSPEGMASRAGLALLVVFLFGWIIAVAERAVLPRGGLRLTRFPLGPRLLSTTRSLAPQFLVFIALLGLVTGSWAVSAWAALIVSVVSVHALRRMAWYVVPAALVVQTLATMKEFHTLGDLVKDASGWMVALVWFALQAFMVCGPLLRTDAASPLSWRARGVALVAGLPGWGAAFWIFSRTPVAGRQQDFTAIMMVLLFGGIAQSLVLGLLAKLIALDERSSPKSPAPSAHGVGMALLPLLLPIAACLALFLTPLPEAGLSGRSPDTWMGLIVLLLIVPAVPAVVLVAAALDRLDGRNSGFVGAVVSVAALGVWFVMGPVALEYLYAADGPAALLRAQFDTHGGSAPIIAERLNAGALFTGAGLGGDVALFGLPIADLCRALTLMLLGCGALAARCLRHARPAQRSVGWLSHLLLLLLAAAGSWHFMPRLGAAGAPLAMACACLVMLTLDILHSEVRVPVPGSEPSPADDVGSAAPEPGAPLLAPEPLVRDIQSVS